MTKRRFYRVGHRSSKRMIHGLTAGLTALFATQNVCEMLGFRIDEYALQIERQEREIVGPCGPSADWCLS